MAGTSFHGMKVDIAADSGVRVSRVRHPANQVIDRHSHDWACLTLFVCGSYVECFEGGERTIHGPAAVLHPPDSRHANRIGRLGLETVSFQIDAALLRKQKSFRDWDRPHVWVGGVVGRAAGELSRALVRPARGSLPDLVSAFLRQALPCSRRITHPPWLQRANDLARAGVTTGKIASELGLHPAWLAHRFLETTGESIQAAIRRGKVERALDLIRRSHLNFASIAAAAEFCDQSHMNRAFRALLGRTPGQIRVEAERIGRAGLV